ncbi:MAG: LppX_LprAFG lipoprotein, partial [Actinomycetia bacterium]|nr:LppX_LprAFG lipoprotein [Actinomycetes bacterium]
SGGTSQASAPLTQDNFASAVSDAQTKAKSAHMEMSIETMGMEIEGSGDISASESGDPKDAQMALTIEMPVVDEVEMRLVDGFIYMKMGSYTQDKFVEVDLSDPDNPFGTSLDDLAKQVDPNAMVEQMAGSMQNFEKTDETKEFDGVEATKYILTMDGQGMSSMMESQSGMTGGTTAELPDEVQAEMWIDDENLLHKMTMEIDEGSTPMSMEMTFSDWGEPVDIEAPGKDEITDSSVLDGMTTM